MPRHSPRLLAKAKASVKNVKEKKTTLRTPTDSGYLPRRSQRIKDIRKKAFKQFNCHIPTTLDCLPTDVIAYNIFPYLDYETRNNLNSCLPVWDRVRTKMPPASIKKHQTNLCVSRVSSMLASLMETQKVSHYHPSLWVYHGDKRIQRMIQMLSLFLNDDYFFIYTHFPRFREVFSAKIDEMWELANSQDPQHLYSRTWLDELISTCNALRNKIIINHPAMVDDFIFASIPLLSFT